MIAVVVVVVAQVLSAQCNGAACPNPCRECAFLPDEGTNQNLAALRASFEAIARRQSNSDLPAVQNIEVGAERSRQPAEFPCKLLPAIGMTESSLSQFCDNGLTVISFDCGFGIMQVTSGAADYPGLQSSTAINMAAGADILAAKWNGNESFGGSFGDSDPQFLESWYFAVWAYNGFVYRNNPENPDHPAERPPFNSPGSLSRGSYPYQELVWGYLGFPQEREGEAVFDAVEVSYPTDIPNQSGLFSLSLPLPQPAHADSCVEVCPPAGCPPAEQRTLILDDEDAAFSVSGDHTLHAEGGFSDRFLAVTPARPASSSARWQGLAPSSGTFDVAAFVPLDPARNEAVVVLVSARGAEQRFVADQSGSGGVFVTLGQVSLLQGEPVAVSVDNDSDDQDPAHAIGLDAFRLQWRGDGSVDLGGACNVDVDCALDALCRASVCVAGCEVTGCAEGVECDRARGLCAGDEEEPPDLPDLPDAGSGPRDFANSVVGGCHCGSSSSSSLSGLGLGLLATGLLRRRRPRRRPQPGVQRLGFFARGQSRELSGKSPQGLVGG